jgi:dTDP-4-amino-4,6-dideoxygalactose transaminase
MNPSQKIQVPLCKPTQTGNELAHIENLIRSQAQLAGGGIYNKKCEEKLSQILNQPTILVTSGTHALELSALCADIKPNDEVILPSFTFVSTANAFLLRGAKIIFADIDETGNLNLSDVERLINPKTKAICTVHYAGNSCDLEKLKELCNLKNILLIEDAAQALDSKFKGKPLGTFGDFAAFSFHDTKNFTSGEGGAFTALSPSALERAEIIREKGTNRKQFFLGLIDKYTWVDIGSSYVLSELNAAYLYPQLELISEITKKRKYIFETYLKELSQDFIKINAKPLLPPKYNEPNYHIFALIFESLEERQKFIGFCKEKNVSTPFHYVALHLSPQGKKFLTGKENLKTTEKFSNGLCRLPIYYNMTENELSYVIDVIKNYAKKF